MNILNSIVSFILFTAFVIGNGVPVAQKPAETTYNDSSVMFISDYQGADRNENLNSILKTVSNAENPGLIVCGGDYQSTLAAGYSSDFGIYELKKTVSTYFDYDMQYLFVQGNHDPAKTKGLNKTGLYEFPEYYVYTINEDDFPWKQSSDSSNEKTVKETALNLGKALTSINQIGAQKPVFIVSHLPLHYTTRSNNGDNYYASYIFDVINRNAKNLDIVYLFGHNHSGTYDDYIGGAVNYLAKGDTINLGGTNQPEKLNFTYTNCGYTGYSNNKATDTSTNTLTSSVFDINGKTMTVTKYSKDGVFSNYTINLINASSKAA